MLREFKQVKQERTPGRRRWFESDGLDLVVWYDADGTIFGFQVCYDLGQGEHALTWRAGSGCVHALVDPGDDGPFSDLTPILVPDGAVPWQALQAAFDRRSGTLDPSLRALVAQELQRGSEQASRR